MLIAFEGIDGSGKNTQVRKLLSFLRQNGVKYKLHKYPTRKAKDAFAHLKGKKDVDAAKLAEVFADDIIAEQDILRKELRAGNVVICDRYLHSTLAYQGVKVGYAAVKKMIAAKHALSLDLVLLLDIGAREGAKRKAGQKVPDRFEKDVAFLDAVRRNYRKEAKENFLSYKFEVIDAALPADEVFSEVIMSIEPLLTKKMKKSG
ncbi:MAG: dTMP kinase [Candidatus Micrarchaeota archaeon]|nr:dTMP kinase [Candidatus Micrarchaeota archaeon]